jgi:hypothetical protein
MLATSRTIGFRLSRFALTLLDSLHILKGQCHEIFASSFFMNLKMLEIFPIF